MLTNHENTEYTSQLLGHASYESPTLMLCFGFEGRLLLRRLEDLWIISRDILLLSRKGFLGSAIINSLGSTRVSLGPGIGRLERLKTSRL